MSKLLGIIGCPIRHSMSPVFQKVALDFHGIDATYQAWEVEPLALPEFIQRLRAPEALGINVTVPHKEAVMAHLDHIDEWARAAGAVNTVVNQGGGLRGYNTDGSGFIRALEEHGGFAPEGARVLILGAGGSARGVALALARRGVSEVTIANRTLERAQALAGLVAGQGPRAAAVPLEDPGAGLARAAGECSLIVNCTTMGMKHGPAEDRSPIPGSLIPSGVLVYDLVYNPPETPLLAEASRAGAATLGGLPMLIYQGAASFQLWTGKEAPVGAMLGAAQAALR